MSYESIATTKRGPGISESEWSDEFEGCDCQGECSAENQCSCLMGEVNNYSEDGKILPSETQLLIECSSNCVCALLEGSCRNRVVQNGIRKKLEVFRASGKGFGVRAIEEIAKGEFVCEYAGECIGDEEVERRCLEFGQNDNYTLTLKEHFGGRTQKTFIDPRFRGNIGRFLNHSCEPNCDIVVVRLGRMVPTAGIFANRNICEGEELCYDYGNSEIQGSNRKLCHCQSAKCRKYLPMSATPSE